MAMPMTKVHDSDVDDVHAYGGCSRYWPQMLCLAANARLPAPKVRENPLVASSRVEYDVDAMTTVLASLALRNVKQRAPSFSTCHRPPVLLA